ncbi:MAG: ABC transporter permease [Mahellales bacterium]
MEKAKNGQYLGNILRWEQSALLIALIVICIVSGFLSDAFFSVLNITNILRQVSLIAIAGIGMVMILLVGEIDLSVGSLQAAVGITAVTTLNATGSISLALLAALATGLVVGLLNGFLVTKAEINSLIATLGTMAAIRGTGMVVTQAVSIPARVEAFKQIGAGHVGGVPVPVIFTVALVLVFYFILNHTVFGRHIYAVGGNPEAAKLAGLPVKKIKMQVYILGNLLFAFSAFILASRLYAGQAIAGTGFEMQVIAAVILGGVSLSGGSGTLLGALIGMLILAVIQNVLVLMNVSSFYHEIVRGIVIILAVYLDVRRKKNLASKLLKSSNK